jgi:hypothetical protein
MDTSQSWLKNCYCLNLPFSGHGRKKFLFLSHTCNLKKAMTGRCIFLEGNTCKYLNVSSSTTHFKV